MNKLVMISLLLTLAVISAEVNFWYEGKKECKGTYVRTTFWFACIK